MYNHIFEICVMCFLIQKQKFEIPNLRKGQFIEAQLDATSEKYQ